jgi:CHASE2 domain-containing sensor protein
MKLHLIQKIGLIGFGFVSLIALVFNLGGHFSPFIFALLIPFSVLILIGYSIQTAKKQKRL